MLRIGLLGYGSTARLHLACYTRLAGAHVVALFDPEADSDQAASSEIGSQVRTVPSIEALLMDAAVDAVDICLPLPERTTAILAALAVGKPMLAVGPLSDNLAQAEEIARAAQAAGRFLMCAHHQIYEPAIGLADALLAEGALGTVYMARTTDCARGDPPEGGELLHIGYHPAYVMRYLLGRNGQHPVAVTATLAQNHRREGEGEDGAQALIRFSGGAIGHLLTSRAFAMPPGFHTFHLVGERGQAFGHKNLLLYLPNGAEAAERREAPERDPHEALIADFVETIATGRAPLQQAADGAATLALVLAAYRAARTGATVGEGFDKPVS